MTPRPDGKQLKNVFPIISLCSDLSIFPTPIYFITTPYSGSQPRKRDPTLSSCTLFGRRETK
ncbi:hypothetical protein BDV27DRAFT_35238 [Aspergillus caelatus]|uniref:Uncharacterized protein n=1 Tax=Aspergillus caelatus TaxID=61420 RepID=A0A5N6ZT10_9EURO|nr:uncharacterized protein BDV27DRAFT_35238 [Aspergillus caelatus]KAE8360742.1 hypothetical protein BDV27DRAFT_35238 [Aspergillus caelatus]